MSLRILSAILALWAATASAVHPLKRQGSDFIDTVTNQRFEVIGVDYQPGGEAGYKPDSKKDPLSDAKTCLRDAIIMQNLGLNCIRVYNLDPKISHDECASIFNAAGIYMIIDVNSPLPNESLNAAEPWTSYSDVYLKRIFGIAESFINFPNLLGFFGGNEVIHEPGTEKRDPPYVRAVTRDLKNYIAKHASRDVPVGYSAADVRDWLVDTWQYLQCALDGDENDKSRIDFFGLNSYSWCGSDATYDTSGYDDITSDFKDTTIPVLFSEYGCNKVPEGQPRPFEEIQALYGNDMRAVLSGGLVYQWTQEDNDYGLVQINAKNSSVSLLNDFDALKSQLAKLDLKSITTADPSMTGAKPPKCGPSVVKDKNFSKNFTLPAVPKGGQDLIDNGVKGAHTGKLVDIKETTMPYKVYGSDGNEVTGLKLNVLADDASNTPSGSAASSSSSAIAAPTGTPAKGVAAAGAGLLGLMLL